MKYLKTIMTLVVGVVVVMSCQDPSFPNAQISNTVRYAKVLFINASPDAPSLVYQVNNAQVASLNPQIASGYINVNPASEQFKIKNAVWGLVGTDTTALAGDLVLQSTLTGSATYTLFVTDTVNRPHGKKSVFSTTKGGLQLLGPISDNLAIASSKAGIRFYNLAPGASAAFLSNGGNSMGAASNSTAYRVANNSFTAVTPGSYALQVTNNSVSDPTVLASQSVILAPGKVYTVFLTGKVVSSVVKVPYALNVVQHN